MTDKAKELINLRIQKLISDNQNQICDSLFNGLTDDMSHEKLYAKMILNSIMLSVDISIQIICEILESEDLIHLESDEKLLQKLSLKLKTEILEKSQF